MLVHVTVTFRNLIFVCITIKDKLIKHLNNSHLRKLAIAHGEVFVMQTYARTSVCGRTYLSVVYRKDRIY